MVVLIHLNRVGFDNWDYGCVKYGWLGVPIFFTISGYCIAISIYHSKNMISFLIKRICRIYSPYLFSIILVLGSAVFRKINTGDNSIQNIPTDLKGLLAMLTLTTYPVFSFKTINWVYWSLTCELVFYLTVSITLFLKKTQLKPALICPSFLPYYYPYRYMDFFFCRLLACFRDRHWGLFSD